MWTKNPVANLSDRPIALCLCLYSLGVATWLLANNIHVTAEDGFYYFKIAENMARGLGPSFDGVNRTNGYHPLWMLFLVPVFILTKQTRTALLVGSAVQAVFMGLGAVILHHTARLRVGRLAAALAALLWVEFTYRIYLSGLEFSLHALCLIATAYVYLRLFAGGACDRSGPYMALGGLLALAYLARLDTILLAGVIGLWLLWQELRRGLAREGIRRLLAFGLPIVLVVTAYAGMNFYLFGHFLTVSSLVKRNWSETLLSQDPVYLSHGWLAAKLHHIVWPLRHLGENWYALSIALGVFGGGGMWVVSLLRRRLAPGRDGVHQAMLDWTPFVLYSLITFLAYTLLYHQGLSFAPWYFVMQPWVAVMAAAQVFQRIFQTTLSTRQQLLGGRCRGFSLAVMLVVWFCVPLMTLRGLAEWRSTDRSAVNLLVLHNAAAWAKETLPADAVVGAWNAGTIGYLSERRVINLDGVVNSWDFYESERHDLCSYWQEMGVTYLLDVFRGKEALTAVPVYPTYARCAARLHLLWSDDRYNSSWSLRAYKIGAPGP